MGDWHKTWFYRVCVDLVDLTGRATLDVLGYESAHAWPIELTVHYGLYVRIRRYGHCLLR